MIISWVNMKMRGLPAPQHHLCNANLAKNDNSCKSFPVFCSLVCNYCFICSNRLSCILSFPF